MLKLLKLIFLFVILPAITYSQISIESNNLRNKIKVQKIKNINTYKANQINTPLENYEIEFQFLFDSLGNMIEKNSFYNGLYIQKELFMYDCKGNILEESWYNADNSMIYSSFTIYEFDKKSHVISKNICNSDSSIRKSIINLYDTNGFLQESSVKEFFEEGENYKEIFSYNGKGKMVSHKIISNEVNITSDETFSYDEKGNVIFIKNNGDEEDKTSVFEYDINNNLIHYTAETIDDEGKDFIEGIYNYDEKGNLSEELIYDDNKKLTEKRKFEIIF